MNQAETHLLLLCFVSYSRQQATAKESRTHVPQKKWPGVVEEHGQRLSFTQTDLIPRETGASGGPKIYKRQ